jgi:hypothetical protein
VIIQYKLNVLQGNAEDVVPTRKEHNVMYNIPADIKAMRYYKAIAYVRAYNGILVDYKDGYIVYVPQTDQWIGENE